MKYFPFRLIFSTTESEVNNIVIKYFPFRFIFSTTVSEVSNNILS